jgi:hypothetical protein
MKKVKYVLIGIVALGVIGAILKPKKKETDSNKVTTEKIDEAPKRIEQEKKLIDLDNSKFWHEYDPIVKIRIYKMIEEKDCSGLQEEFNITAENMDKLQSAGKSASRNIDLMDFLEDKMKDLDCHN